MKNLNLRSFFIFSLLLIVTPSYGQFFRGYIITSDNDSIVSEFQFNNLNQTIVNKVDGLGYDYDSVNLIYDINNDDYYRTLTNPDKNDGVEVFKVLEEGKYSYYQGKTSVVIMRDTVLVFFPLTYGYNQSSQRQFVGLLNYVFEGEIQNKDLEGLIEENGRIKSKKLLNLTKRFNRENYNKRFRTKSKIKPQFYIGAGYSGQFFTQVRFSDYYPTKNGPVYSSGSYGYSIIGKLALKKTIIGLGYNSVNANIAGGRYHKFYAQGYVIHMNIVDDIKYKSNRLFVNAGYRFDIGRVGLQPLVQWSYATIKTDTVKVNVLIEQHFDEGTPLYTPTVYEFSGHVVSFGVNVSFSINSKSQLETEIVVDANSVTTEGSNGKDKMTFKSLLGLSIRYVYKLDF